jgi:SAM-dependent methyltransferase
MALLDTKAEWEDLGELDPYWATITAPDQKHGHGDLRRYLATGEIEIEGVMAAAKRLGFPVARHAALDFGCGLGRLTRALSRHFDECWGVDISESMIGRATELHQTEPTCHFRVNSEDRLAGFRDGEFDLIYSNVVLQHAPDAATINGYIRELVRTLAPGGLLSFQLPSYIPWRKRVQPRRRLYHLLRGFGVDKRFLYEQLSLYPIRMNFVPEENVVALLEQLGAKVLDVHPDTNAGPMIESRTYYATR